MKVKGGRGLKVPKPIKHATPPTREPDASPNSIYSACLNSQEVLW